jgi:hypothetical protein
MLRRLVLKPLPKGYRILRTGGVLQIPWNGEKSEDDDKKTNDEVEGFIRNSLIAEEQKTSNIKISSMCIINGKKL